MSSLARSKRLTLAAALVLVASFVMAFVWVSSGPGGADGDPQPEPRAEAPLGRDEPPGWDEVPADVRTGVEKSFDTGWTPVGTGDSGEVGYIPTESVWPASPPDGADRVQPGDAIEVVNGDGARIGYWVYPVGWVPEAEYGDDFDWLTYLEETAPSPEAVEAVLAQEGLLQE